MRRDKRSLLANKALHEYQAGSDVSGINTLLAGVGSAAEAIGGGLTKPAKESGTQTQVSQNPQTAAVVGAANAAVRAAKNGNTVVQPVAGIIESAFPDISSDIDPRTKYNQQINYGGVI